jgi:hypothetical protein
MVQIRGYSETIQTLAPLARSTLTKANTEGSVEISMYFSPQHEPEAIGFFSFAYLTPRIRITPKNLTNTKLAQPAVLHFICSPARAASILSEVREVDGWFPTTIYEPIPVCDIHWVAVRMLIKFRNSRIDVSLKNYRP